MKLEITRAFGVVAALGVLVVAAAAWSEPSLSVISAEKGRDYCPAPLASVQASDLRVSPDLMLLMFSLSRARVQG